jgi:hypothetical protein
MKKLFLLLCCVCSTISYGQQQSSGLPQSPARAVPTRTVSRSALQRHNSTSASAPATPLSSSPSDRQVSFSGLAAHASSSEPSSPRPPAPMGTAPTPLNALIRDQDRVALAGERQAAALERQAAALERMVLMLERLVPLNERLLSQGESNGKVLKSMSKSLEALVVAHASLHDDEANPGDIGMRSILFLADQREKIINSRSSGQH